MGCDAMCQPNCDDKRQPLQDELMALGSLVEELLLESVDLLRQSDLDALERLSDATHRVHKKRLAIEMACLSLIATRRPRDGDLRCLVAMVEIAAELEHVAEHARKVARVNYLVADHQLSRPLASIQRLARMVQSAMSRVLEAFARGDLALTAEVLAETKEVNAIYEQTYQELLMVMQSKPGIANQAIYLSRAAYNLKRAAERVVGVSEWVAFSITGAMGQPAMPLPQPTLVPGVAHDDPAVS
jgi:phosphate transport system protein